jgi:hypothetical protein
MFLTSHKNLCGVLFYAKLKIFSQTAISNAAIMIETVFAMPDENL